MTNTILPLREVCQINPRFDNNTLESNAPVTFIPMAAVDESTGTIIRREERALKDVLKGFTPFQEGDVIFAKITPCMENGKSAIADNLRSKVGFGSTEFHVLRPKKNLRSKWVHYFVRQASFLHAAENSMTGSAGQKRVPKDFFSRAKILVPSLKIQDRTIELLTEIECLLQKRREAICFLDFFVESRFCQLFGDVRKKSSVFANCNLGELASFAMGGTPNPNIRAYYSGNIRWVKGSDLEKEFIYDTENKISEEGLKNSNSKLYESETLLIGRTGQGKTRGKVAILMRPCATNETMIAVRINDKKRLSPFFLLQTLKLRYKQLREFGGDDKRGGITQRQLESLNIVTPPFQKQNEFVALSQSVNELKSKMKSSEAELQNLFNCLMQKAFKGELF